MYIFCKQNGIDYTRASVAPGWAQGDGRLQKLHSRNFYNLIKSKTWFLKKGISTKVLPHQPPNLWKKKKKNYTFFWVENWRKTDHIHPLLWKIPLFIFWNHA